MDRKHPGVAPPSLSEDVAAEAPEFREELVYIFEIIPVVPLTVAPGVTPPVPIITPAQVLSTLTSPPRSRLRAQSARAAPCYQTSWDSSRRLSSRATTLPASRWTWRPTASPER